MAYYVRTYYGGGASYDPRRKTYAEFHCDSCSEDTSFECRFGVDMHLDQDRPCSFCGSIGKDNKYNKLIAKKERLENEMAKIKDEIENIINELNQVEQLT